MRRFLFVLFLAAAAGAGLFFHRYRIDGFDRIGIKPRGAGGADSADDPAASAVQFERHGDTIRIASFDIQDFGPAKLNNPSTMNVLCEVARRFDVVAVQEIRSPRDDLLPRWIDQINATGRHYDFVIGNRQGHDSGSEQFAIVFDAASVEIDRTTVYTVDDPGRRLARDPLVASFRVRGPPAKDAFTFTLMVARVDRSRTADELAALADAYRAVRDTVRDDGTREDDIILAGNLNADNRHLGPLGQIANMSCALAGAPTTTSGTKMCDNILFNRVATIEFTGRSGVLDLLHEFSLPMSRAVEISDHLPIWAEFSAYEGGQVGRLASRPE